MRAARGAAPSIAGFAIACLAAACAPLAAPPAAARQPCGRQPGGEVTMRFLALGDSYTIGEGVDAAERWPAQLAARLREHGLPVDDPQIIARTGWTTDELAAAIDRADPSGPYDLVTLLIGVNNQYRGRSLDEYRAQFTDLLQRATAFAGGRPDRVIVVSIPDWSLTPFAAGRDRTQIARELAAFNRVNAEAAALNGARYVDVTPHSRTAADDGGLLAGDGLHPSGRMYAEWARLALPAACAALGE